MAVEYIEAEELAEKIRSEEERSKFVVVDVRDEAVDAQIVGAVNAPSQRFSDPAYVEQLISDLNVDSSKTVVFHCQYSQKRGPASAAAFYSKVAETLPEEARPKITVLRGGFNSWSELYQDDSSVTEKK